MQDLYEFTRRTLQMNLHVEPGAQLAELVHEIFALEAVVIFDADLHEIYQAGYWNVDPQELAQNVYYFETSDDDPETGIARRVVRLGTVPIGSVVLRGETSPLTNNAIASLIAVTFDRYRAFANESRIETERQTEQLRSTVLDSLAHEYKTPLTAIRAASTGLQEMGKLSAGQSELVSLINEQADLLNDLTTRLLTTARLDAGEVTVHAIPVGVASLIDEVVASLSERLASMKVAIDMPDDSLVLCCDRRLMTMLLIAIHRQRLQIRDLRHHHHHSRRAVEGRSHLLGAQLRPRHSHRRPRAHLRPLLSLLHFIQSRLGHRNRLVGGQARRHHPRWIRLGHQRPGRRQHVLCGHPIPGTKEGILMNQSAIRILIVDDESAIRRALTAAARRTWIPVQRSLAW